ncbi:hypothetical protein ACFYNZ_22365 [Streptomyces kebangsaanensis]|uniref:Integrase n=1 Tax=Streptomyces kebangsaanensis TaxID=864058 RepID=A0ABW6KWE1_9ACTN
MTLSIAYPRPTGNDPYSQGCQPGIEGGFATQAEAAAKAEEVWRASKAGMNVLSDETVTEFLARWLKKKTELKGPWARPRIDQGNEKGPGRRV